MAKAQTNKYGQTKSQFSFRKMGLKATARCSFPGCRQESGPFRDATQWAKEHVWRNPLHIVEWERKEVADYWMPTTPEMEKDIEDLKKEMEKEEAERKKQETNDPPGYSAGIQELGYEGDG